MNSVVLPTSFAQERLWFLAQLQPGSAVYNMTSPLRLSGRLAVEALEAALQELVRRQEVLRTTFRAIDGRPVQVVHESVTLDLVCEDLSTLAVEARDATVDRVVRDESNRPFDLGRGPLFRARLLRLSPDEHVLLLVAHHIVSDGWSLGVMVRETSALYSAFATGAPSPLPEPPIQYADYAQWQREWLQGNELERQLAYWRARLRDLPEALGLHTDFPRPAASSGRGGQVIAELPPDTCAALRTLCRDEQVTQFVVLMAVFQALIARYTGSVDIVVGSPVANRSRPELEGLVGFFVNTLIVRGDLSGDPDVRTLVGRIGGTVLAAFDHQDVPFERVVEAVAPQRDLSRSPLFQVMLVLQNAPIPELAARGLRVSVQPHETETAKFDLTLSVSPSSTGGLALVFEYSTDLFERASIERMAAHYRVLLEDAVARPDTRLSELAATTREERRRLLIDWNDTRATTPRTLVHEAFVHQARSTPAAPALVFEGDTLSYAALADLSGRLARRLRAHGVGPDVIVGLCADRSFDLPAPMGVPGELLIGGDAVSRGYLGRPDLTAERFVPDPWSNEAGARLYRSGDLVKYRPDGSIAFLGRIDAQVKIRGFRVEPAEVEAVLQTHPSITRAVVIAQEDGSGQRQLVAYVVPERDTSCDGALLATYLRERLPDHLVPGAFVTLAEIPLTPSGKVDRRALPAPGRQQWSARSGASRGPIEATTAELFADVLNHDHVGIHDNFFERGGHSLAAVQVVARARSVFAVDLPLRTLFETPTPAGVAAAVERALGASTVRPPLTRATADGPHPLSFAQDRLWFIDRLNPGSSAYHINYATRLRGDIDTDALRTALTDVMQRHDSVRTRFVEEAGRPVARVDDACEVPLSIEDLRYLAEDERAEALRRALRVEAVHPYSLTTGPLLRIRLWRLGEAEWVAFLGLHHVIADGWSLRVLARELAVCYSARLRGERPSLPELPVQYGDYARWQRAWLTDEALHAQIEHWRQVLADAPLVLEIPPDRLRPAQQAFEGAFEPLSLDAALTERLRALTRRSGTTLFMTLLAAFQALLARSTGVDDLLVGVPVANRTQAETEGLIGFFVNTLVLRGDLHGNPTFAELLERVKARAVDAYAHQEVPFERLVDALDVPRDLSRPPLCQVMFAWQDSPLPSAALPGVSAEDLPVGGSGAKFDLSLGLNNCGECIDGGFEYATALYEPATVRGWCRRFIMLLDAVTRDPSLRVSDIPLWDEVERREVMDTWGHGPRVPTPPDSVDVSVSAYAARTPDAVAVACGKEGLTYAALETRANQLAHRLRTAGVGPDVRVGICMPRSVEIVVAMLATLKAGGAYVPLDPEHPVARHQGVLNDSHARVLLTAASTQIPQSADILVIDLRGEASSLAMFPDTPPPSLAHPDDLAYVLYTSGSTGQPKGVMVTRSALDHLLAALRDLLKLTSANVFYSATTLAFDAAELELLVMFAVGGQVEIARAEMIRDGARMFVDLKRSGATHMFATPASWRLLVLAVPDERLPLIAMCGGEALPPDLAEALLARTAGVWNVYGPTETTVMSTTGPIEDARTITLGPPIAGTYLYVVDRHGAPVPAGVPGELVIGGMGVARGYLDRPDLTAERFVPDAWSGKAGVRVFRTGDRVRFSPTGTLLFLGRLDAQVKMRGFRIEPGEVEAVLSGHDLVQQAAVVAREEPSGDRRLVAYVVAVPDAPIESATLKAYLQERLPDYMVPSAFVQLAALPLSPNGKVDRRALPVPSDQQWQIHADTARGPIEEAVAEIVAEVLDHERVGIHDDFFELGGHSLAAARVIARLRDVFGLDLPVKALFEGPTVGDVAARIEQARPEAERIGSPPLVPRAENELPLLSFAQERLWFLDQMGTAGVAYHVEHALRLDGSLDVDALERSVTSVIARHEALRTTFETVDGKPAQNVREPQPFRFAHVDLSTVVEAARHAALREHVAADARRPFDLARGPLVRGSLARLAPTLHVGVFTLHHIVTDGWSMGVLIREIGDAYAAHLAGRSPAWEPLPVQYPDYAVWQRRWLHGSVLDAHLRYWRGRLGQLPDGVRLATDRPRPPVQSHRGGAVPFHVPSDVAQALQALGLAEGTTLFMTLLAAFKVLLARYTGQTDLVVGTPTANRTKRAAERLIGFFANTLVLRTRWTGEVTFQQVLAAVKETCLGAYAHQEMPFERLVEALAPERDLSRTPLFQIMFVLQNTPTTALSLGELRIDPWPLPAETAKFDLTLTWAESGGGLRGVFEYSADLFDGATIERLSANFLTLLTGLVARPDAPISSLPLLADGERRRLSSTGTPVGRSVRRTAASTRSLPRRLLEHRRPSLWLPGAGR